MATYTIGSRGPNVAAATAAAASVMESRLTNGIGGVQNQNNYASQFPAAKTAFNSLTRGLGHQKRPKKAGNTKRSSPLRTFDK